MNKFNYKKRYGQNFLKNQEFIEKITQSVNIKEDDLVIEIGPGQGALTKSIQNFKCQIICYEIDKSLKPFLDKLENAKTKIIYENILEASIKKDINNYSYNHLYVVANLPYYITTPIIKKLIEEDLFFNDMVLMVQKEVAQRFTASQDTKNYGSISAFLNYFYDIVKLFDVPASNFFPKPNVDSAVIKLKAKEKKVSIDIEKYSKLLKDAFKHKRKTLKNNLYNYDLKKIAEILKQYNYTLNNRAEQIPYYVYVDIVNTI